MPVCVGLALLGLMGAGIKRCLLYRRLGRAAVELKRGSHILHDDKGYTIENPMPKSRRSYMDRQIAKTLNQVNKTQPSSNNSINNPSRDAKVCMEIATVSGGSVGMPSGSLGVPAGSLRRTASERMAPSRKNSFLGDCKCYCHCPLCGQMEVKNGSSTTGTATTRL
ncbi:uncharacterized protein LOC117301283 [Asterias rubens]|uniref:uncharacterized protein LOC117301283 n=1 Tax=Asterias rubens TaxID=7604 RepID=UPI00145586C0|nr:uncharacterized protein LOC117301283 [Asterias rubens]